MNRVDSCCNFIVCCGMGLSVCMGLFVCNVFCTSNLVIEGF